MSLQLLTQFEQANNGIADLVERDLMAFLETMNFSRPDLVQAALFEFVPTLISKYGDIAATVAADWFESLRVAEGVSGAFRAPLAPLVPLDQVNARLGFATRATGPLWAGDSATLSAFLGMLANEYALQPGRDTVMQAAHKDHAAYARVPEPGACKFCLMLASRGFVYGSESAAGKTKKFHGKCRCNAIPVWDETRARVVYGYDPIALYDQYRAAEDGK
jgi:hypothetical protein